MTVITAPSEAQVKFIEDLLAEKELTDAEIETYSAALPSYSRKEASQLIDLLLTRPKKIHKVGSPKGMMQEALAKAPKSKYAVPNDELDISLEYTKLTSDHLFVEIREYMGNLYMRRLHGAPGGFSRSRVNNADAIAIVEHIAKDPYKYARTFGEIYSCCGSCGAELTDVRSRELMLGPECRKKFGYLK
jgi:hypothetical protein